MRVICAALLLAASAAFAADPSALQARDINGDGTVDAYYDSAQNITWLADANYRMTLGLIGNPALPGSAFQPEAAAWAAGLDVFGVTGWRLPSVALTPGCTAAQFSCRDSIGEMTHLRQTIQAGGSPFINYTPESVDATYWAGTVFAYDDGGPQRTFGFAFHDGSGFDTDEFGLSLFSWPVHDGDVFAIPEPSTYALVGCGLILLALRRRLTAP